MAETWKQYMDRSTKYAQQFPQYIGNQIETEKCKRKKGDTDHCTCYWNGAGCCWCGSYSVNARCS